MHEKIETYINSLFEPYNGTKSVAELKSDLLSDLNERFEEQLTQGKDQETALSETLDSIGDIEATLNEMAGLTHTLERQMLVNFSAQDLVGSDFAGVIARGGKFNASAMQGADFSGADLTGSTFKASDLTGARFDGANLTGVKMSCSGLSGVSFHNADLTDAELSSSALPGSSFAGAKLTRTKLSVVDLKESDLMGAVFNGTIFHKSDLSGMCFEGAVLTGVIFDGATLMRCDFKGSTLMGVSFKPYFAVTNKYYKMLQTVRFSGAAMDKLTYHALKAMYADLSGVAVL